MRAVALALVLVSAPAWATNVFFSPFINPNDNQRDVLYLTDSTSPSCIAPFRAAHVETDGGHDVKTGPICWWFAEGGGFNLQFVATGASEQNASGFGVVPGADSQYKALMRQFGAQETARAAAIRRSMNTPLQVHP